MNYTEGFINELKQDKQDIQDLIKKIDKRKYDLEEYILNSKYGLDIREELEGMVKNMEKFAMEGGEIDSVIGEIKSL